MLFMRRPPRACAVVNEHEPFTNLCFRHNGPARPLLAGREVMAWQRSPRAALIGRPVRIYERLRNGPRGATARGTSADRDDRTGREERFARTTPPRKAERLSDLGVIARRWPVEEGVS